MHRRNFLTKLILAGGACTFGPACGRRINPEHTESSEKNGKPSMATSNTVTEPARQIPILAETDVLVIGGGPAGSAAAIAASRAGAETWLVERYNHLGGLWTGGLVLPLLSTHGVDKNNNRRQVIYGIAGEMFQRLKEIGMCIEEINPIIDPEATKYVIEKMVREAGVKVLYHTWCANVIMDGETIKGVFLENKSGRMALLAKVVIDCTGDGDIFHWTGDSYDMMKYHIGLVHRLGNVDCIDTEKPGYQQMSIGGATPIPGVNWVNMWGKGDQNGVDALSLSELQTEYRLKIWEDVQKIRQTPGHEKVFLLDTASQLGVRVSRILEGEYRLSLEDSMTYKSFDDVIGICGAWTTMLYNGKRVAPAQRPMWQIPYRSLLPKKTENLLVAGRCFSYTRDLVEDARIIGVALITGHGAGAAAGLAVKEREQVKNIDIEKLKKLLRSQGAWLG
ncbi:MAG: FAD-dependent oxidoreductase [Fermentimonas sp.]|jgi:hypothetical protein